MVTSPLKGKTMNSKLGVCPVCNGTKEVLLSGKDLTYSWNKGKTHRQCDNCGGQTMFGQATGQVPLRKDNGEPCVHEYTYTNLGRCYHGYTCKHCGYNFKIDSSD